LIFTYIAPIMMRMDDMPVRAKGNRDTTTLPFRLRESFLSGAEIAVYRMLKQMIGERYIIFSKVSLNEVFSIVRPNENVHYFNKLFRKYVDFLLCDSGSLKPQIGVELIRAAGEGGVREADRFMEELFVTAGLPLVQLRAGEQLGIPEMAMRFQEAIERLKHQASVAKAAVEDSVPMCPVCGKMMVLRTQRSGKAEGRLYYGCIDNPTCPGRVALR
jgi:predicted RNA-binding Zn-ribbon protein involved in translation (DUF1610 family)